MLRKGVSSNYRGLFEDWEIAVVTKLVDDFRRHWQCLQREEFGDLLQECLIHWLFTKESYDSTKGASEKTYLGRVIRNKLTELVRDRETDKRKLAYITISLDGPIGIDDGSAPLIEKINEAVLASVSPEPVFENDSRIDLSKVLKKLTPEQRTICFLIGEKGFTVKEASQHLKTPRSTLYDEIKRIRKIFRKEGLEEYLQ